jgi:hypothetical protein
MKLAAGGLLLLGLSQMAGDALGRLGFAAIGSPLALFAKATTAAPAPRLLASLHGMEPWSNQIFFDWDGREGRKYSRPITPGMFHAISGPPQRRQVFQTMLLQGPILRTNDITRPMFEAVQHFALTGDAPLVRELGIDPAQIDGTVRVRYDPRTGTPLVDWPRVIEVERR